MVVLKVVVPPSVVMLMDRVVYNVAFILVVLYNVGSCFIGLPSVVLQTGAQKSSQRRR